MANSFWRVRLGEAVGYKGNEKVFDKMYVIIIYYYTLTKSIKHIRRY